MKLTNQQIKEIAENLDCGMRCFYNIQTGKIKSVMDVDDCIDPDEYPWKEEMKEINDNWSDYIEFEKMSSNDSFQIMVDFTEQVQNSQLQDRLINSLNNSKPFRNFKWQIDNSGEYRQIWFDFKDKRYIEWVKDQLEQLNMTEDNE